MHKQGVTFILPCDKWETKFEDIPFLEEPKLDLSTFRPLIKKVKKEPIVGETGMTITQLKEALKLNIKGHPLTDRQRRYLETFI